MKYFTRDLWKQMNSGDKEKSKAALDQWNTNSQEYMQYIRSIRRKDIRKIHEKIMEFDEFHDYDIDLLEYNKKLNVFNIFLSYIDRRFRIHFYGVKKIRAVMEDVPAVPTGLRFGYYELEYTSDKKIVMSIVFDFENEIEITADGIKIREITAKLKTKDIKDGV